ncbi:MAG: hypothetical protein IJF95_01750 [Erysipelotrichaceae bacterium]|nr:hypothetical protein [Erysipelotrichaceae bacterium]
MVYDIVLNFKNIAYDFYEWNSDDEILNIKEILAYKVRTKTLIDFCEHEINVNDNFLDMINDKTEAFYNGTVKKIKYACILYDDDIAFAFLFNKNGKIIGKSKLLFEESDEIVDNNKDNKLITIDYIVVEKGKVSKYKTRNELNILQKLYDYLDKLYSEKKYDELRYIYFEFFDKKIKNNEFDYEKFKEQIAMLNYFELKKLSNYIRVFGI